MNVAGQFAPYNRETELDPNSGPPSILQIRDFLVRQWHLIAVMTALTLVLAAGYLAISPFRYTAQADMIIDTKRIRFTQSELDTENRNIEDASVESEIETTRSERVAISVAN